MRPKAGITKLKHPQDESCKFCRQRNRTNSLELPSRSTSIYFMFSFCRERCQLRCSVDVVVPGCLARSPSDASEEMLSKNWSGRGRAVLLWSVQETVVLHFHFWDEEFGRDEEGATNRQRLSRVIPKDLLLPPPPPPPTHTHTHTHTQPHNICWFRVPSLRCMKRKLMYDLIVLNMKMLDPLSWIGVKKYSTCP